MKKSFRLALAFASLMMVSGSAMALTLEQAMNEVAGYSCSGSECTKSTESTTTVDLPDTEVVTVVDLPDTEVTSTEEFQIPGDGGDALPMVEREGCWTTAMDGTTFRTWHGVNEDCVPQSIMSKGTARVGTRQVTTVVDGGTENVVTIVDGGTVDVTTCTTTTKTLTYNGPHTDRAGAWSVDSSDSSSDGAC